MLLPGLLSVSSQFFISCKFCDALKCFSVIDKAVWSWHSIPVQCLMQATARQLSTQECWHLEQRGSCPTSHRVMVELTLRVKEPRLLGNASFALQEPTMSIEKGKAFYSTCLHVPEKLQSEPNSTNNYNADITH